MRKSIQISFGNWRKGCYFIFDKGGQVSATF